MEITGIGYVGLESPNHEQMRVVGPKVFGFGLDDTHDDGVVRLRMDDRFCRIAVHPGPVDRIRYIGFEVRTKVLWDDAVETLRRGDIDVEIGDRARCDARGVSGVASFTDPSGWPFEIFHGQWFRPRSFLPGRPHGGFYQTERYGIGHMILPSSRSEECSRFVETTMGFRPFHGFNLPDVVGYRTKLNPYSHNFGYQEFEAHEVGDTDPALGGLHLGIYCNDFEDVPIAFDRAREVGLDPAVAMMMPAFDCAVQFQVRTPAGLHIQYHSPPEMFPHDTYVERMPQPGHQRVWGGWPIDPPRA